MATVRVTERVQSPFSGCRVDRENGVLVGVKLCGLTSANRRDYPPDVFRRDFGKYEGVGIFADHDLRGGERSIEAKFGWVANPRVDADGTPRGDVHLLKTHRLYEPVMEAAERNPALYGFSHIADLHVRRENGRERVESIAEVLSVDLVASPATTKGFFESKGTGMSVTLKQLAESVCRHPKATLEQITRVKRLAEMDGLGDVMADAPADDAEDVDDPIKGGFKAAIMHVIEQAMAGDMDPKDALAKVKSILMTHRDVCDMGGGDPPPADDAGGDDAGDDDKAAESRKAAALATATREAIAVCKKVGFKGFDADDLDELAGLPAERRESRARKLMLLATAGEARVTSEGRAGPTRGGAGGGDTSAPKPPASAKEMVSRARG